MNASIWFTWLALSIAWTQPIAESAARDPAIVLDIGIFGKNDMADLYHWTPPYRNQCDHPSGILKRSTGRLMNKSDGQYLPIGTAETVIHNDIIVTSSHVFDGYARSPLDEKEIVSSKEFIFRVYNYKNDRCSYDDYGLSKIIFKKRGENMFERNNDIAVIKLSNALPSDFGSLQIATKEQISRAKRSKSKLYLTAFPFYESNIISDPDGDLIGDLDHDGKLSPVMNLISHTGCIPLYTNEVVRHDCDTWKGSSGGSMVAFEGEQRILVAVHVAGHQTEAGILNDATYNEAILVDDWLRETVISLHRSR